MPLTKIKENSIDMTSNTANIVFGNTSTGVVVNSTSVYISNTSVQQYIVAYHLAL
jgi:hypothetical protein